MNKRNKRTFGTVRKLPSGRYQARFTTPTGELKTAPETFTSKLEADSWLAGIRTDLNRGKWINPNAGTNLFNEYVIKYLEQRQAQLAPRTFQDYSRLVSKWVTANLGSVYLGSLQLRQISPQTIKTWNKAVVEQSTATTAAYCYRILRAILSEAVRDELIETNPCKLRGAGHVKSKRRVPPTFEQVKDLIDLVPDRYKTAVLFASLSGLRRGEQFALRRKDVDLIEGTVSVERAQIVLKNQPLIYGEPKSEAGKRTVALPQFLITNLKEHLALYANPEPEALIFTTESGTPIIKLSKWWNRARKQLNASYTWHDLRHTAGIITGNQGATLAELMHRLGHSTVNAAMTYQHSTKQRDKQLALNIDNEMGNVIPFKRAI
jgi:integrase